MGLKQILNSLDSLSVDDLREVNHTAVDLIKAKRKIQGKRRIRNLSVGDKVTLHDLQGIEDGTEAEVADKHRTRVTVTTDAHPLGVKVPASNTKDA